MSEPTAPDGGAATAGGRPLLPRGAGEILASALRLWRAHLPLLFAVGIVPQLPGLALIGFGTVTFSVALMFIGVLASILGGIISTGALIVASLRLTVGRDAGFGDSFEQFWPSLWPYALTSIVFGIAVTIGLIAFVLPGLIVGVLLAYACPAVIVERIGVFAALKRTFAIGKGYFFRTLLSLAAVLVSTTLCAIVIAVAFKFIAGGWLLSAFVRLALAQAFAPLVALTLVGLYVDQRGRQEQITVEALLRRFDGTIERPWGNAGHSAR